MPGFLQIPAYYQPHNVDRTYDYELKYKADEPGKAAGPDARIWKIYLDEADSFDHDMLQGFRDNIDALLVFAALFSAVVTTFTVETKDFLQPDYPQITAFLLAEQLQLLRTGGNVTAMSNIPSSTGLLDTDTPSWLNIWMAGLFFTSLSFSLSTALLSILVKQWLTSYSSLTSGDTQLRCLIRQFRFTGLENWKLPQIISFLPLLLHFSLAIFLIGFSLFAYSLYPPLSAIIISITATTFTLYVSSSVLPAVHKDCPFRIPIMQDLVIFFISSFFHVSLLLQTYFSRMLDFVSGYFPLKMNDTFRSSLDPWTPPLSESQLVQNIQQNHIVASLDWLFHQTSNASVRKVTTFAASDLVYHRGWIPTIPTSWFDMVPVACNELFTQYPPPNCTLHNFLQLKGGSLQNPDTMGIYPADTLERAVRFKQRDLIQNFLPRGIPVDLVQSSSSKRMLLLATESGDMELVQDLLRSGAKCNLDGEDMSPLLIAIENGYPDIASLLIQNGASTKNLELCPVDALEHAMKFKWRELILQLMSCGLPPDFVHSPSSKRVLVLATENGDIGLIKHLLKFGAKCNLDGEDRSPLVIALDKGYPDVATLLLQNGANTNLDVCTVDPLERAVESNWTDLILQFLSRGLSPDYLYSPSSKRMLVLATKGGKFELVQDLLRFGAKCDVDGEDVTPLCIAVQGKYDEIASFLLEKGALVDTQRHDGWLRYI